MTKPDEVPIVLIQRVAILLNFPPGNPLEYEAKVIAATIDALREDTTLARLVLSKEEQ